MDENENYDEPEDDGERLISIKILEHIARAIGDTFSGTEILSILKSEKITDNAISYPNTKWKIVNELFISIRGGYVKSEIRRAGRFTYYGEDKLKQLIEAFMSPLNHKDINETSAKVLADKIGKFLKYDNLYVVQIKNGYRITDEEGLENLSHEDDEEKYAKYEQEIEVEKHIQKQQQELVKHDLETISENKKTIEEIFSLHQTYIDLLEVFCDNPTKPTEEQNSAYLFLKKTLSNKIRGLNLILYRIELYSPFNNLYSAEKEWDADPLKGAVSWEKIRLTLNNTQGQISWMYGVSRKNEEQTDSEKKISQINELISKHRTGKAERKEKGAYNFYITRNGDDFRYNGVIMELPLRATYAQVFRVLYSILPEGGLVQYGKLIEEVGKQVISVKKMKPDAARTFIQNHLTGIQNGFLRSAKIQPIESNGKPLISVERTVGIYFNNRAT